MAVGAEAAAAMIAERAGDGAQPPQFYPPAPAAPGVWQATPSCSPAGGVFLHVAEHDAVRPARAATSSGRARRRRSPACAGRATTSR